MMNLIIDEALTVDSKAYGFITLWLYNTATGKRAIWTKAMRSLGFKEFGSFLVKDKTSHLLFIFLIHRLANIDTSI